ncbi:MAG: nickel-dependent lactate racemase [Anaerovibrio sp.]|uniref:nickel-dependent lactate racemase n=1 Tax=Anaerovibrio sp. TaxID=1872532 RepID=UPI0025CC6A93|nr:nickel-dependent lactate racemase [Anaerovibrio sp.]MCR5177232.1 nickel-dependent lactate racemase [Anaerovibrio sp.]
MRETKTVSFLYGEGSLELDVPKESVVLASRLDELKSTKTGREIVHEAMTNPIDSPLLSELAKGKPDCTIIISDHTRPVPSKDILPEMIEELRRGNPDIKITLLVATGFHRATTIEELKGKLGDKLYDEFKDNIIVHNAHDPESNIKVGVLPSGPDCIIDKAAANASLLVAEGFIEAHFFAGFSGGRKSVLPGICDAVTVMGNHCGEFIASPYARTGILKGNPMHKDMVAAAKMAKLAFICNVVIDEDKQTVAAFAGNFETAHFAGTEFLAKYCAVKPAPADIVITTNGGYPLDQNAYQCPKGMTAAEASINEGGVIIMAATCIDGHGGQSYYDSIHNAASADEFFQKCVNTPQTETLPDQWCAQIWCRILRKHTVLFVADPSQKQLIEDIKAHYFPTLQEAYAEALRIKGENATVTCIPNGISVIVRD